MSWWILGLLALLGCTVDGAGLDEPAVELVPAMMTVEGLVGEVVETPIRLIVRERGVVERLAVDPPEGPFSLQLGNRLVEVGEIEGRVVFEPRAPGTFIGRFTFETSVGAARLDVNGVARNSGFAHCEALDFGPVAVNTSRELPCRVTNDGAESITVRLEEAFNAGPCTNGGAAFCWSSPSSFDVPAGESAELTITFQPTGVGIETGALSLLPCEAGACGTPVSLTGRSVEAALTCDQTALDFGDVAPGECSDRTVTCTNDANGVLVVEATDIEPREGDFNVASPRPSLSAGDSFELIASYCASRVGPRQSARLVVRGEHSTLGPQTAVIQMAARPGGAELAVTPEQLDFGDVSVTAPAKRRITLSNVGYSDLVILDAIVGGRDGGAFSASFGAVLEPGEYLEGEVLFHPAVARDHEATLTLTTNDPDAPEVLVPLTGRGVEIGPCAYGLSPGSLDFYGVDVGEPLTAAVTIQNVGQDDCLITGTSVLGGDPEFVVEPPPARIPAGTAAVMRVRYLPTSLDRATATIELGISSPVDPFVEVSVSGEGVESPLLIGPQDLDIGQQDPSCASVQRPVRLHNRGGSALVVTGVTVLDPGPFSVAPLAGPVTLAPFGSTTLGVSFDPSNALGTHGARIAVDYDSGGARRQVVSLEGGSAPGAIQVDTRRVETDGDIDVLFVLDHSGGHGLEHAALVDVIGRVVPREADYQIGVTTSDIDDEGGRLVHAGLGGPFAGPIERRIVTPRSMPSPWEEFGANVPARPESGGAPVDESHLEAARLALSQPLRSGDNVGFLRPDAALLVILLGDEDDQSPGSLDFYSDAFLRIKGERSSHRVTVSAIGGDVPGGCPTAMAATRMIEVARRMGGTFASICTSDWEQSLSSLTAPMAGFRSTFRLTGTPVPGSTRVFVDGVEVPEIGPSGTPLWLLEGRRLSFAPAATPLGGEVSVTYAPACL